MKSRKSGMLGGGGMPGGTPLESAIEFVHDFPSYPVYWDPCTVRSVLSGGRAMGPRAIRCVISGGGGAWMVIHVISQNRLF